MTQQINRKQIAAKLGISEPYMLKIAKEGRANMPKSVTGRTPVGIFYLEHEIDAWIVANFCQIVPLPRRSPENKTMADSLASTNITPLDFIQGKLDRKGLQDKYRIKKMASSVSKPVPVRVVTSYSCCGEYCE